MFKEIRPPLTAEEAIISLEGEMLPEEAIISLEGEMLPEVLRLVNIELSYIFPNIRAEIIDNCINVLNVTIGVDTTEEELICWCVMVEDKGDYYVYKSIYHTEAVKRFVEEVFFTNWKNT